MSTSVEYVVISTSSEVSTHLPAEPAMRSLVLELGLRQWRICQALEAYKRGQGTLAYAAEQAGVSVREIIPLAYVYGLTPPVDPDWLNSPLTLEQAAQL
jgi:hypothetical protein